MYSFLNPFGVSGFGPYAPLVQGQDGTLYGVTFGGGKANCGTIFSITLSGSFTLLHEFDNSAQGECSPFGAVTQAGDGRFYGTTRFGLIYRVTTAGEYSAVRRLNAATEGATLESALVVANDTVSGVIDNFGWALTPQPSVIPFNGSTITVNVDGLAVGHPTYDSRDITVANP